MSFADHKDRGAVDGEAAKAAPVEVEHRDPVAKYPASAPNRRRVWTEGLPFLGDPPEGRERRHTATAIEAQPSKPHRTVRTRGQFPSDETTAKSIYIELIYLARTAPSREWIRSVRQWRAVKSQRAIVFQDRFPMAPSKHPRTEFRAVSAQAAAIFRALTCHDQSRCGNQDRRRKSPSGRFPIGS